jgi:hypothetical protein
MLRVLPVLPLFALLLVLGGGPAAAQYDWTSYKNERYGFTLEYPAAIFEHNAPLPGADAGHAFFNPDGTEIVAQAMPSGDLTLEGFLKQFQDAGTVTDQENGDNWFMVTRKQDGTVWHNKAIFSCGGQVLNHLSMGIPAANEDKYEFVVNRVTDSFHAGKGKDTPADCKSD